MTLLSPEQLEAELRDIGARRYHHLHPFHKLLHAGELDKGQVQAWALNRYYYQSMIPVKDAAILARMLDPELRRAWRQRIIDHDGEREGDGGIVRWLALTDALGLDRAYVESTVGILPATKFVVETYVHFVREKTLLEAIASSLTEMFAPTIIATRVKGMLAGYDFISKETLAYFDKRLTRDRLAPEKSTPSSFTDFSTARMRPLDWFFMSAERSASRRVAPVRSALVRSAVMRAPRRFAPDRSSPERSRPESRLPEKSRLPEDSERQDPQELHAASPQ